MQYFVTKKRESKIFLTINRVMHKAHVLRMVATAMAISLNCAQASEAEEEGGDRHAGHHHAVVAQKLTRSLANYAVPDVPLMHVNRTMADLRQEIDDGRPVVLNFVYTSCTAVCPMTSQTFAAFQARLGSDAAHVHMVSISIDPEHDTPERLAEYRSRYRAGPQWSFFTGTLENSIKIQKAFDSFFTDKMNHRPITYLRAAPGKAWVRLEGFVSPDDLIKEFRALNSES